jgi:hypothetical protein
VQGTSGTGFREAGARVGAAAHGGALQAPVRENGTTKTD